MSIKSEETNYDEEYSNSIETKLNIPYSLSSVLQQLFSKQCFSNNKRKSDHQIPDQKRFKPTSLTRPASTESSSSSSLGSSLSYSSFSSSSTSAFSSCIFPNYVESPKQNNFVRIKTKTYLQEHGEQDSDQKIKIKSNFLSKFFSNIRTYFESQPYDVCFILDTNQRISAHQFLLINSSNYFRDKIENSLTKYIRLEGVSDFESLKTCIEFVYSAGDEFTVCKNKLNDLKNMAILLELDGLVVLVQNLIIKYPVEEILKPKVENYLNNQAFNFLAQNQIDLQNILNQIYFNTFRNELANYQVKPVEEEEKSEVKSLTQTKTSLADNSLEIDTISRDFLIKDKYIYPSMLLSTDSLNQYFDNFIYINLSDVCKEPVGNKPSEFMRHSLVIFCLSSPGENFDSNNVKSKNYVVKSQLNFTDLDALKEDLKLIFASFLQDVFKKLNLDINTKDESNFRAILNRVCYLKKPSNCKTIKLETIKTSTDCFRAIVEYSRANSSKELPYVLVTCHATINFS